jgi:hypothetical protein
MRTLVGLVTLTTALGCLPELPPLEFHGERVVVGSDVVAQVCEGTLARLDREVVEIERRLDLGMMSEPLRVYVVAPETVAGYCDGHNCTEHPDRKESFILLDYNLFELATMHELVHARLSEMRSIPLLAEGVAEAVSPPRCPSELPVTLDPTKFLGVETSYELLDLTSGYYVSGEFVAWLLDEFGGDVFLRFYASVNPDSSLATISSKYREHFDREIDDDLFAHVRAQGDLDALPPEYFGCLAPPAPEHDGAISLAAALDCDSELVHNEFNVNGAGYVEWTLTLAHAQKFNLAGAVPEGTSLTLQVCGCWRKNSGSQQHLLPRTFKEQENIAPGTYRLRWSGALDEDLTLDVELVPTI